MNFLRGNRAVHGVVPAGQRLDLDDGAGPDVGDGLVHHAQLRPALEGMGQQAAQHEPAAHALVVFDRIHLDAAPTLLGQVHGDVRPLEQQRHVIAVLRSQRDAGAGRHGERQPIHVDRA